MGTSSRIDVLIKRSVYYIDVIEPVIFQHAENASMLSLQRADAVAAPHYSLKDLEKLDWRLEAHLDGLRVAGEEGWKICLNQLRFEERGEVFTAGALAFQSGEEARIERVFALHDNNIANVGAIVSALAWLGPERALPIATAMLESSDPVRRLVGLGVLAVLRIDPGRALYRLCGDEDTHVRARASKALGELGRRELVPHLVGALRDPNIHIQLHAARSNVLLANDPSPGLAVLRSIAETAPQSLAERAVALAGRRMGLASAKIWHRALAQSTVTARLAVQLSGQFGDPELMPWTIEQMRVPPLARVAGEAFTTITGVGIDYRDLDGELPDGFESGPTEDPADGNIELDPDEDLPWPDPKKIADWWQKNRGQFQNGTRYLCGKPISIEWCKTVLRDGFQRQRAAAALELAILQPGTPLFNVKAPGFRQIQLLGKPEGPIR